jgi:hypothetical protein
VAAKEAAEFARLFANQHLQNILEVRFGHVVSTTTTRAFRQKRIRSDRTAQNHTKRHQSFRLHRGLHKDLLPTRITDNQWSVKWPRQTLLYGGLRRCSNKSVNESNQFDFASVASKPLIMALTCTLKLTTNEQNKKKKSFGELRVPQIDSRAKSRSRRLVRISRFIIFCASLSADQQVCRRLFFRSHKVDEKSFWVHMANCL